MKNIFNILAMASITALALGSCGLNSAESEASESASEPAGNNVISAEFPGGTNAILDFIGGHISYPEDAMDLGITGNVYVEFTITESGAVANATVLKSLHPSLDAAAIEAALALPNFAPATRGGKAIATTMTLPVSFRLQ
jgi:TonB family protein